MTRRPSFDLIGVEACAPGELEVQLQLQGSGQRAGVRVRAIRRRYTLAFPHGLDEFGQSLGHADLDRAAYSFAWRLMRLYEGIDVWRDTFGDSR